MRFWVLAVLVGCANVYDVQERAESTADICGVDASGTFEDSNVLFYPSISQGCVDAILDDYNADDSLREQDLTNPGDFESWGTAQGSLVGGGWALLNYDWQIDHMSLNGSICVIEAELGDAPDGWSLYNWSTAQFKSTTEHYSWRYQAAYNVANDQLRMDDPLSPLFAAGAIVHESKHAEGSGHVACWYDKKSKQCDRDWSGAYGASWAMFDSVNTEDPLLLKIADNELERYRNRINPVGWDKFRNRPVKH